MAGQENTNVVEFIRWIESNKLRDDGLGNRCWSYYTILLKNNGSRI